MALALKRGSIIWATIPDSRGENPTDRPCIVMDSDADIAANRDLHVVGISTSIPPRPLPSGVFDIPSKPGGDPRTGLEEAGVVYADWTSTVPQSLVRRISGRAAARLIKQIEQWQQVYWRKVMRGK